MCRSEPQTPPASTVITASSGAIGSGSGRSSSSTRPGSWKVTASIGTSLYGSAAQQGRRPVTRVVQLGEQPVDGGKGVLEADRAAPLDRPARVVQAERQAGVDIIGGADSLADRERRLVHELADHPAEHEARRIRHPLGVEPAAAEEALDPLAALAGQLNKARRLERRPPVEPPRSPPRRRR